MLDKRNNSFYILSTSAAQDLIYKYLMKYLWKPLLSSFEISKQNLKICFRAEDTSLQNCMFLQIIFSNFHPLMTSSRNYTIATIIY